MTNVTISTIQIKRGTLSNMPTLLDGEFYHAYDEKAYYIGQGGVNQLFSKEFDTLYPILSRLGISSNNKVTIDGIEQIGGSGSGVLVYDTLTDLQNAYPNGTNQPAWIRSENVWYYWDGTITQPIDTTPPNDVTNLTASSVTATSLTLSWPASTSTDIASYDIYQGSTLLGNTASTSYNVTGLTQNTSYTFTVKAKDTSGNVATGTSVTQLTATSADTTAPNDVTNLTTSNLSTTSVTLNWTASNSPDVASYDIYNGSTFVANTANTSYTVTGLTASTQYTLTVKAKDSSGNVASGTQATFTTAAPPADTTPPVITASPAAGTYTSSQSVTLSSNETGTSIYYTTNGSTPTTSSTVYSGPIPISATTTLQFIGKDAAGNISTPVAATYTINIPAQSTYLQMNGTTDWLRLPSMAFDKVVMDVQLGSSTNAYILDARSGIANGQVMNGTNGYSNWSSGISSALKDGVAINNFTNGTFVANERHTYTFNYSAVGTDNINVFSANNVDQASNTATPTNSFQGNIYDIKLYNSGTLVAHYDFTTGSLNDQTGQQGKALLTGGTWNGVTPPTVTQYLQLNGTTDYVRVPSSTQLQLTNNFKIQVKASLANLTQTDKYFVNKNNKYSMHEFVSAGIAKTEFYVATFASGSIPAVTQMTIPDTNAHTITYQYDGTTLTTTLDGTNVYSGTQTFVLATDSNSLYIGSKDYQTSLLAGNIYDVQIFNGGTLVAHYDFTKGTIQDQSGNGNHGILTGGTWVA